MSLRDEACALRDEACLAAEKADLARKETLRKTEASRLRLFRARASAIVKDVLGLTLRHREFEYDAEVDALTFEHEGLRFRVINGWRYPTHSYDSPHNTREEQLQLHTTVTYRRRRKWYETTGRMERREKWVRIKDLAGLGRHLECA